ncbi:MAG: thioredoxin family protein [Nanoarchaeota archaeon]|nr:thioredoxin family protein [Nanoarchaeota archaeon]
MKIYKIGGKKCPECTVMRPRFAEIEKEMPDLKTEYFEDDENPELIKKYHIIAIPTFLFLDDEGNELSRLAKIQTKERLIEEINKFKEK